MVASEPGQDSVTTGCEGDPGNSGDALSDSEELAMVALHSQPKPLIQVAHPKTDHDKTREP
jgi:hypothetical protein